MPMVVDPQKLTNRCNSFTSSLISLRKIKEELRLLGFNIALGGNYKTKKQDHDFSNKLGIKTPRRFQSGVTFENILIQPDSVFKPCCGKSSMGVFTVSKNLSIRSVKTGNIYQSKEEARKEIEKYSEKIGITEWDVEELITLNSQPANDLKIYFFYGTPLLFLEIDRNELIHKYCWSDEDGTILTDPELYTEKRCFFKGTGIPKSAIEMGKIISLNTPVPLLRIDFLKADNSCVLGEITPNPGRYAEGFPKWLDSKMGKKFNQAWAELLADLISGKQFDTYFQIYS